MTRFIVRRRPRGYLCWCAAFTARRGWRQVGAEALAVVDDFGWLVFVGAA